MLRRNQKSLKVSLIFLALNFSQHTEITSTGAYFTSLFCFMTVFPSPLSTRLSGTSSPEWIGFQEAEYKFFDHRTTWDQAQRICSWFDSSLASVHSAEEEAFLANTLAKALLTLSKKFITVFYESIQMCNLLLVF